MTAQIDIATDSGAGDGNATASVTKAPAACSSSASDFSAAGSSETRLTLTGAASKEAAGGRVWLDANENPETPSAQDRKSVV